MEIRQAREADIQPISQVYKSCFPRESNHELWIRASFSAYPKSVYYVVADDDELLGYVLWSVKNGFRRKTIVELEQVGVHPDASGQGLGRRLIKDSIKRFESHLRSLGHNVAAVLITTSRGNFAEHLYCSTLGVKRVAEIPEYGSGTELILYNSQFAVQQEG